MRAFFQRFVLALLLVTVFTAARSAWRTGSRPTRSTPRRLPDSTRARSRHAARRAGELPDHRLRHARVRQRRDRRAEHFGEPGSADRSALRHDHGRPHRPGHAAPGCSCRSRATCGSTSPATAARRSTPRSTAVRNASIETIKQNFDIPISHYLEVDFAGFRNIVNAIGTVPDLLPDAGPRQEDRARRSTTAGCQQPRRRAGARVRALALLRVRQIATGSGTNDPHRPTSAASGASSTSSARSRTRPRQSGVPRTPSKVNSIVDKTVVEPHARPGPRTLGHPARSANAFREVDPGVVADVHAARPNGSSSTARTRWCSTRPRPRRCFARLRAFGDAGAGRRAAGGRRAGRRPRRGAERLGRTGGQAGRVLDALQRRGLHGGGPARPTPTAATTRSPRSATRPGPRTKAQLVLAYLGGAGKLVALDAVARAAPTSSSCSAATSTQVTAPRRRRPPRRRRTDAPRPTTSRSRRRTPAAHPGRCRPLGC